MRGNKKGGMDMLSITNDDEPRAHGITQKRGRMPQERFEAVDKYKDAVYRAALTVTGNFADAEDIMQEVFLQYYRAHPAFESERHEKAWLMRCTVNAARNLLRSSWHRKRVDLDLSLLESGGEEPPDSSVLTAVLSLPERYRTAIYLYYYENYSVKEIAQITGRTEAAVGQHLSRGRAKLRKKLGGDRT